MSDKWFDPNSAETPPAAEWWWAVEHIPAPGTSHPAFYLRTLMAGDFQAAGPAPRHVLGLDGEPALEEQGAIPCGTCGEVPRPEALDTIERQTGDRGQLTPYRNGEARWPKATRPASCWLCSNTDGTAPEPRGELLKSKTGDLELVMLCARCSAFVDRCRKQHPGPHLNTRKGG